MQKVVSTLKILQKKKMVAWNYYEKTKIKKLCCELIDRRRVQWHIEHIQERLQGNDIESTSKSMN